MESQNEEKTPENEAEAKGSNEKNRSIVGDDKADDPVRGGLSH